MPKLIAIGLDAMDRDLLQPMMDRGELPNISSVAERGARILLDNELYRTTMVWETFLGVAPEPFRYSGMVFDPDTYRVRRHELLPRGHFFSGIPSIALDVPHLPLSAADGGATVFWAGHIRTTDRGSDPPGLLERIEAKFGTHPGFDIEHSYSWHKPETQDRLVAALSAGSITRGHIAAWLLHEFPATDLFLTVFSECHSVGENFAHGLFDDHPLHDRLIEKVADKAVNTVYRAIDEGIGAVLAAAPPDTPTMIFSPYGIGPNTGDVPSILTADLLYRERFGEGMLHSAFEGSANGSPWAPVIPAPDATWDQYMRAGFRGSVPPDSPVDLPSNLSIAWHPTTWYRPFWPQMKAFSLPTFGDTGIRINLQGRESDGLVPLEDYSKACDEVSAVLTACTDARTGRVAVDEITNVRETDPLAHNGQDADLLVSWVPGVDAIEHPTLGRVGPLPFKRTGAHNSQGFAFIDAPNIVSGRRAATELTTMIEALLRSDTPADR